MHERERKGRRERDNTDKSLREERLKSDREIEGRSQNAVTVANSVVAQAREDADELLRSARKANDPHPDAQESRQRLEADDAIRRKREAADLQLTDERRERTRALAALFALEREVTDRHLQAERNRADLAVTNRDDFLGMVAHDLRGFMAEIALRASWLRRIASQDEMGQEVRKTGERIQRSTAGMNRLVGDLLDIAALEAGKLTVDITKGDLANVVHDSAEGVRSAAEAKNITLVVDATSHPLMAHFDHERVVQVLGNLLSNAIKFTPPAGTISLRLEAGDGMGQITVSDNGEGVPVEKLGTMFDRFAQVRPDRRGVGLGLYISKCLMEAQHGRIWATSNPGGGTQVHLSLPLSS
jgi:signal transduction histidine kinase